MTKRQIFQETGILCIRKELNSDLKDEKRLQNKNFTDWAQCSQPRDNLANFLSTTFYDLKVTFGYIREI